MDITIKKIKVGKGKLVFEYDKKEDEESLISTHTSKFEEEPEPEFWRIFGLLSVDVCKILEVDPGQLAERMIPTGVSYSTDGSGYDGASTACHDPELRPRSTHHSSNSHRRKPRRGCRDISETKPYHTCVTCRRRRFFTSRDIADREACLTTRIASHAT